MSSDKPETNKISPEIAARLVGRLIEDPAFRELFQKDAAKALAEIGVNVDAQPECCDIQQLASVDELRAVQAQLEQYLSTSLQAMFVPHCFEAGKAADSLE
ncbi:NHLP-related RiPP peptide [Stenotrophomonas sp. ISL-67]|uniref:NHLP-related RiPP peptide n=1 Tax=Stenotrophomonas sp. ISL-67 TaxID=2819171 RepID=UPI001BE93C7E|nr:NHLP-related RiPP peptide [Stenotrophomonas sp. ISL-67]MBT2767695.1 NHLP-related RiPP peptide [Stenotrophomonas sp. ISL-67]